jgi:hypothetical protein
VYRAVDKQLWSCDEKMTIDLRNILLDIHALEEEWLGFERKCGIRSEILDGYFVGGR